MEMELARKPGRIGGILATCTLAFGGWFALAAAALLIYPDTDWTRAVDLFQLAMR